MSLKLLAVPFLAASLATQTASAQDAPHPPLNTPIYQPVCSAAGLVSTFTICSVRMMPSATLNINGEPAMMFMQPAMVCGRVQVNTDRGMDMLEQRFPHALETISTARADMADPTKACPAVAMF